MQNKRVILFSIVSLIVPNAYAMRVSPTRIAHNQVPLRAYQCSPLYHPPVKIPLIPERAIDVVVPHSVILATQKRIRQMNEERRLALVERNRSLFDLACKGKLNIVARWFKNDDWIEKSLVLNQVDQDGRSMLIKAAQIAHLNLMGLLLSFDAYAVICDNEGTTALNADPRRLTPYLVERLLEKGAYVDAQDSNGNTALHLLAIKHNPRDMTQWSPVGENLSLCQSYHRQSAKHLLDYGADIHKQNDFGDTPYTLAKVTNNTKMLKMFDAQCAREDKPL